MANYVCTSICMYIKKISIDIIIIVRWIVKLFQFLKLKQKKITKKLRNNVNFFRALSLSGKSWVWWDHYLISTLPISGDLWNHLFASLHRITYLTQKFIWIFGGVSFSRCLILLVTCDIPTSKLEYPIISHYLLLRQPPYLDILNCGIRTLWGFNVPFTVGKYA